MSTNARGSPHALIRRPERVRRPELQFGRSELQVGRAGALWRWAERLAWTTGLLGLSVWAAASLAGTVGARHELERFTRLQSVSPVIAEPDRRLWSTKRISAWRDSLRREAPPPLAVLRIPGLGVEVAVLEGTDDWTLNRAVGHIEDTASPGAIGNSGIAGHRDGFFRGLKDIRLGDRIEIETAEAVSVYEVTRTWIVSPEDVSVLDPTESASITLVTCYPFYFVGPAPQRFIVRAARTATIVRQREAS